MKTKIATLALIVGLAGCTGQMVDTKAEGEKLMTISREWSIMAAAADVEKTLSVWADDAAVLAPGEPMIRGKDHIREMVGAMSKMRGFAISWEPITVQVSKGGDMAYMIAEMKITTTDSLGVPSTQLNKSVTIWKREGDGAWKNIVDTWNAGSVAAR